jgi:hypothetical protein
MICPLGKPVPYYQNQEEAIAASSLYLNGANQALRANQARYHLLIRLEVASLGFQVTQHERFQIPVEISSRGSGPFLVMK